MSPPPPPPPSPAPHPQPPARLAAPWRALRLLAALIVGLLQWTPGAAFATLLALSGLLWWATGQPGSLERSLRLAQPLIPALQSLWLRAPRASLRHGGPIDVLIWQGHGPQAGQALALQDAQLHWHIPAWRQGLPHPLHIQLSAASAAYSDTRSPIAPSAPPAPPSPSALQLPFPLQLRLSLGHLTHTQWPQAHIQNLHLLHRHTPGTSPLPRPSDPGHHLQLQLQLLSTPPGAPTPTVQYHHLRARLHSDGQLCAQLTTTLRTPLTPTTTAHGQLQAHLSGPAFSTTTPLSLRAHIRLSPRPLPPVLPADTPLDCTTPPPEPPSTPAPPPASQAQLSAHLLPWAPQPIQQLHVQAQHLDLATWLPGAPHTRLSGHARLAPTADPQAPHTSTWQLQARLHNATPRPWDQGGLPLDGLELSTHASAHRGQLTALTLQIAGGRLHAQGQWHGQPWRAWAQPTVPHPAPHVNPSHLPPALAHLQQPGHSAQLQLRWERLHTAQLHSHWPHLSSSGQLQARLPEPTAADPTPTLSAQLQLTPAQSPKNQSSSSPSLQRPAALELHIAAARDALQLRRLQLHIDPHWRLSAQGQLPHAPGADWDGNAQLHAPGLSAQAQLRGRGPWPSGRIQLQLTEPQRLRQALPPWQSWLPPAQPDPLTPLLATLHGPVQLDLGWASPHPATPPSLELRLSAQQLQPTDTWHLPRLSLHAQGPWTELDTTVQAQLQATAARSPQPLVAALHSHATLHLPTALLPAGLRPPAPTAPIPALALGLHRLELSLSDRAPLAHLRLAEPTRIHLQRHQWQASPSRLLLSLPGPGAPAELHWQTLSLQDGILHTQGQWQALPLMPAAQLAQRLQTHLTPPGGAPSPSFPLEGDLLLDGQWSLRWPLDPTATAPLPELNLQLSQRSGDLQLAADPPDAPPLTAGLRSASLQLRTHAQHWQARLQWQSQRLGQLDAELTTPLRALPSPWPHPSSPLRGHLHWRNLNLTSWAALAPPGWRFSGLATLEAQLSGSLGSPDWRGSLGIAQLGLTSSVEGLSFANGNLQAQLSGTQLHIQRFALQSAAGGTLDVQGHIDWPVPTAWPQARLSAQLQRLAVSSRADRRLTLSGQAQLSIDTGAAQLRGSLRADQARFLLPDQATPALGSDVIVRQSRQAPVPPTAPRRGLRTDIDLQLDLGPQFHIQGQGIDARLSGQLRLSSPPASDGINVLGEVQIAQGSYRAWGQTLRIDPGVLRFSGPYDDPALAIDAIRTIRQPFAADGDQQRVGVRISGSARQPIVRLIAQPDMPDADKLAWLILGRPASGVGVQAALLQRAALALLVGSSPSSERSLLQALGLDDISIQTRTPPTAGGPAGAADDGSDASLLLGKRLSSRLYIAYEQSLTGSLSALSLFYELSRRLTLRARAGTTQALDLLATIAHD